MGDGDLHKDLGRVEGRLDSIEEMVKQIGKKVDKLETVANMGRGAWWALLKLGAIIAVIVGFVTNVWDKFHR